MKFVVLRKLIIILIILTPLAINFGCKKQKKCGCGKDVLFTIDAGQAYVYYDEATSSAYFFPYVTTGSTYYFCNPGAMMSTLKKHTSGQLLLVSGKVYYECNYYMNAGNYGYYVPPVYQVDVTEIREDSYGKK
jgi:hypothetical protein